MIWMVLTGLWLGTNTALADDAPVDISPALEQPKKAKWDPKGKAMDPYIQAGPQLKKDAWAEAITLYVEALDKQAGCGKCLRDLSEALIGAERYDDAVAVAELLGTLYPDKNDGLIKRYKAHSKAGDHAKAIEALDALLEKDAKQGWAYWARTSEHLNLGDTAGAAAKLEGIDEEAYKKEDVACLHVLIDAAEADLDAADGHWTTCEDSEDADLRRTAEGWLALAKGDAELAAKRLMLAGADDQTRLALATVRLEQGEAEAAANLLAKLLPDLDQPYVDATLVQARALHAQGKADEAVAALTEHWVADGWPERLGAVALPNVLLRAKGKEWPKASARSAVALYIELLKASGDDAQAVYDQAVEVFGEHEELAAALASGDTETAENATTEE